MKIFIILTLFFIIYVPTLILLALTPYITRKTESFGVSIPEDGYYLPEVKSIRENYRNKLLLFGGVVLLLSMVLALVIPTPVSPLFAICGLFIILGGMFAFYLSGHNQMKAIKESKGWKADSKQVVVGDTEFKSEKSMISPLWFVLYPLVILATLGMGWLLYGKMPDRIPMHYNIYGEADRWVDKSYKILLWAPILQVFLSALFAFVYWMIGKSKQVIDTSNREKSIKQSRIFRHRWSALLVFMGLAMLCMFGFMQYAMAGFITNVWIITSVPLGIGGGAVVGAIVLSVTTGQGGSRVYVGQPTASGIVNRDDDKYWKLGMFYYNPDDPALFVEKRFGIGWTNNFARPLSWVILLGLVVVLPLVILATSLILTK